MRPAPLIALALAAPTASLTVAQEERPGADERFLTSRASALDLPLPGEEDAFVFAILGDRTGGPAEGVQVLAQAVAELNLLEPDLVMTVGDLIQGYNQTQEWREQAREYRGIMDDLACPWFPVAGNHDVYWRGAERPEREHEADYEAHFGPLWYAFRHKNAWFVVLYSDEGNPDTGEKTFSEPAAQRMSPEQWAWLEGTLARAAGAEHVFVFLHHPRWTGGGYGRDWERVHELLAAAGNVSAVFAGHIHRMRYDGPRDGIEYFTLATTGGAQRGDAPQAGFLHHYDLVSVRPDRIGVITLPVGAAIDPRRVTAAVGRDALAFSGAPSFTHVPTLVRGFGVRDTLSLEIANPTTRPIELALLIDCADLRWGFTPDHRHEVVDPGATLALTFGVRRVPHSAAIAVPAGFGPQHTGDPAPFFRLPRLTVQADYLAEDHRVRFPTRTHAVPVRAGLLPEPALPASERALLLDGEGDHLRVEQAALDLGDGPLSVEVWLRADDLRGRRGLLDQSEGAGLALSTRDGVPTFSVHLDGLYVEARAATALLATGAWQHVAGVFDGAEARLYVDGERVAATPAAGARKPSGKPVVIGADVGAGGRVGSFFSGALDEVRISRGARYTGERFEPARRLEADADSLLLLHADADVAAWLFDSSPLAAHPLRRGDARTGEPGG